MIRLGGRVAGIAILVLVHVAPGCGESGDPVEAARVYFQAVADQDPTAVCDVATETFLDVQSGSCVDEIQREFDSVDDASLAEFRTLLADASFALAQASDESATVTVAFSGAALGATGVAGDAQEVRLVKVDGEWRVDQTDDL